MQPRRPQPHLAPLMRTTMWPISPAVLRPTHGLPSRIRPPPTPVPQKTPSSAVVLARGADLELGVGREVDVVAERDRRAAELLLERLAQVERARPLGQVHGAGDGALRVVDAARRADADAGEVGDASGRPPRATPRARRPCAPRSPSGPPLSGVWSRFAPEHLVVVVLVHDRGLDLRAAEVDAAVDRHGWHLARSGTVMLWAWRSGATTAGGSRCPRDTSSRSPSTGCCASGSKGSSTVRESDAVPWEWLARGPRRGRCWSASGTGTMTLREQRGLGLPWSEVLVERGRRSVGGTRGGGAAGAASTAIGMNLGGGTHHAGRDFARGYCLFNDVAVTLARLRSEGLVAARAGRRLRRPPGRRHRADPRPRSRRVHAVAARRPQLPVRAHPVRPRRRSAVRAPATTSTCARSSEALDVASPGARRHRVLPRRRRPVGGRPPRPPRADQGRPARARRARARRGCWGPATRSSSCSPAATRRTSRDTVDINAATVAASPSLTP